MEGCVSEKKFELSPLWVRVLVEVLEDRTLNKGLK